MRKHANTITSASAAKSGGMPRLNAGTAVTRHKYGAKRTEVDGIVFASKAEAKRYQELKLLERAGAISDLRLQPRYDLIVKMSKVCAYVADFEYFDERTKKGVIEDVKGMKTPIYRLKKKLFEALYYPLVISEV